MTEHCDEHNEDQMALDAEDIWFPHADEPDFAKEGGKLAKLIREME